MKPQITIRPYISDTEAPIFLALVRARSDTSPIYLIMPFASTTQCVNPFCLPIPQCKDFQCGRQLPCSNIVRAFAQLIMSFPGLVSHDSTVYRIRRRRPSQVGIVAFFLEYLHVQPRQIQNSFKLHCINSLESSECKVVSVNRTLLLRM